MSIPYLDLVASQVRRDIIRMIYHAQSGHPGGSLGCADFFVALYFSILRTKKFMLDESSEDLFFLSNGHITPAWYSVLARRGYFPITELKSFRKINSRLQGHPANTVGLPGIHIASGSLGQGLSVSIGAAMAKKLNQDPYLVYVLMGDGEQQEGQIWEAAMSAAHYQLDNIIATVDCNQYQTDGKVKDVMSLGNLKKKWEAFGWHVIYSQGNDIKNLIRQLKKAQILLKKHTKPIVNLMHTTIGKGVSFMENTNEWHSGRLVEKEYNQALEELKMTLQDF